MSIFEKMITITNYNVNHLFPYYPYTIQGEKNPKFDRIGGLLLDLKAQKSFAITFFQKKLAPYVKQGHVVCVVPSHDPSHISSGIRDIALIFVANGTLVDGTSCLVRSKLISKLSAGGSRTIQTHLDSVQVVNTHIIRGKSVLLLDDITTSKHSLQVCKYLLIEAGASTVECLALGETTH